MMSSIFWFASSFLLPLLVIPWVAAPISEAKIYGLAGFLVLGFAIWLVDLWRQKKVTIFLNVLHLCYAGLLVLLITSLILLPAGVRVRSLLSPLGAGGVGGLILFSWLLAQTKKYFSAWWAGILTAGVVASLLSLMLFLLPKSALPWTFGAKEAPWLIVDSIFSPLGSLLATTWFLAILTLWSWQRVYQQAQKGKFTLTSALALILLLGTAVSFWQLIQAKPRFLDWFSSWAIAVETFKRKPLLGVGPGNFNIAFARYRPVEFNQTANWQTRFTASHSWWLQTWSEWGVVGLILWLILAWLSWQNVDQKWRWLVGLLWVSLLFLPANFAVLFLLFGLLTQVGRKRRFDFALILGEGGSDVAPWVFTCVVGGSGLALSFLLVRAVWASVLFKKSLLAAAKNQGGETYNLQRQAIAKNRFLASWRITFSQTNLALANSLASKKDLTEQERKTVVQLIQQAIAEAKAAVALEPQNVVPWQNLANIYRQLSGLAQGAEDWATVSYQQAVGLEPTNPVLRVDFGGFHYALGKYEQAARQFEIAVNLKPDFANGWYNWAWALKQQEKLEEAVEKLQQALNLVEKGTPDWEKAKKELDEWKEELGKTEVTPTPTPTPTPSQLQTPQPLPSPKLENPIELPAESAPPATSSGE